MSKQRKTTEKNGDLIKGLFNELGWRLERHILELDTVERALKFLDSRRQELQRSFGAWVGDSVDEKNYGSHQSRLPGYEARGLSKDLRHFLTGEFDVTTRMDTRLLEILSTPRCRSFLSAFLQTDHYYIHYPPMVRFKIADASSSLVPVHQDAPYNAHLSDFVTVWVPLVDIDDECGGIIAYEGSHQTELMEHKASGAWANKATADTSAYTAHHIHMNAGDALLFPPTLLHESAPHRSARVRYSIDFRVIRDKKSTTKSYYDPFTEKITEVKITG
jgi:uncharacterized protein YbaR (Trm112 family)